MKQTCLYRITALLLSLMCILCSCKGIGPTSVLTEKELRDRITASWVGQMIGVTWAASTEFRYVNKIIPESEMPVWSSDMVNDAFVQDDLFAELPFMNAMKDNGIDCSMEVMGRYFADSTFWLAHANRTARDNIRNGIPAAEAGHYKNNCHADDIDWQIESDFVGNIYPGYPTAAAKKSFDIGHLVNYGDGVYGGVWVAAMHAAAFTAENLRQVIDVGLEAIPKDTKFRTILDEVVTAYDNGVEWETLWQQLEERWGSDDKCPEHKGGRNIDAKLNAAYVLIGLLYGEDDFEKTIIISTRCGQDSDCNPSTAASVLGTLHGLEWIPEKYRCDVEYENTNFTNTEFSLSECIDINVDLAKEYLNSVGAASKEGWSIPKEPDVEPVPFEQWPDGEITAYLTVTPKEDSNVSMSFMYVAPEDVTVTMDMGDGTVFDHVVNSYKYQFAGTYTITCTVKDSENRSFAFKKEVKATGERPFNVTASSSNANPEGCGSQDPNVMCDGEINKYDYLQQYDTYPGESGDKTWFALSFDRKITVSKVYFTEGAHLQDGGWFKKTPKIEALVKGKWVDCKYELFPKYAEKDSLNAQGKPFETFTFTLKKAVECDGIRVIGSAGGSSAYASCAELDVAYTKVENPIEGQ